MEVDTCEAAALSTATTPAHILYFARSPPVPSLLIRKRVITVEPKVPLANERTFLAWMEWAIFLSGASIAFASVPSSDVDPVLSQILSVLLIPFAIGAILHAFNQCELNFYQTLRIFFFVVCLFVFNYIVRFYKMPAAPFTSHQIRGGPT
jgi:uncharacterized membrane protein YidH (DUF202 family)